MALSEKVTIYIDKWLAKFPKDKRRSAVIAALLIAQEENDGWLSEVVMKQVAAYLQIADIEVYEVATFYDMYNLEPTGKHKINVCTNISCMLRGANGIVAHLEERLNVKVGATTADGLFTINEVECLGACCNAPVCQVDDKDYLEDLTIEKVDSLIDRFQEGGSYAD